MIIDITAGIFQRRKHKKHLIKYNFRFLCSSFFPLHLTFPFSLTSPSPIFICHSVSLSFKSYLLGSFLFFLSHPFIQAFSYSSFLISLQTHVLTHPSHTDPHSSLSHRPSYIPLTQTLTHSSHTPTLILSPSQTAN